MPYIRTCSYNRHVGYKNIPVIRTLYAVPDDVLITGIHCIRANQYIKRKQIEQRIGICKHFNTEMAKLPDMSP